MPTLPVNAIFSGIQPDGHWAGTPSLIIQVMDVNPADDDSLEGHPLEEWPYHPANEITLGKLLERRGASAHFANIGHSTLSSVACSYRERHVLIYGRDPGLYDLEPLVAALLRSGRTVQVETTILPHAIVAAGLWVSLLSVPRQVGIDVPPPAPQSVRPDEVLASVRSRSDIDRIELAYGDRRVPVWLRPSPFAQGSVLRQCITVATRHPGWRVMTGSAPARQ